MYYLYDTLLFGNLNLLPYIRTVVTDVDAQCAREYKVGYIFDASILFDYICYVGSSITNAILKVTVYILERNSEHTQNTRIVG